MLYLIFYYEMDALRTLIKRNSSKYNVLCLWLLLDQKNRSFLSNRIVWWNSNIMKGLPSNSLQTNVSHTLMAFWIAILGGVQFRCYLKCNLQNSPKNVFLMTYPLFHKWMFKEEKCFSENSYMVAIQVWNSNI